MKSKDLNKGLETKFNKVKVKDGIVDLNKF